MKITRYTREARRSYRSRILHFLRENGPHSRTELTAALKLPRATAALLFTELIEQGILSEQEETFPEVQPYSRGRRKVPVGLNENYRLACGLVLERGRGFLGLTNLAGQTVDRETILYTEPSYRTVLSEMLKGLEALKKRNCLSNERILAVGICMGSSASGLVEGSSLEEKLQRLRRDLARVLPHPVAVCSTVEGAAEAQAVFRQSPSDFVLLRDAKEVGGGRMDLESCLRVAGRIYAGSRKQAGGFAWLFGQGHPETDFCQRVAEAVRTISRITDIPAVYGIGGFFEDHQLMGRVNQILNDWGEKGVQEGIVQEDQRCLAPCAAAVSAYFYGNPE